METVNGLVVKRKVGESLLITVSGIQIVVQLDSIHGIGSASLRIIADKAMVKVDRMEKRLDS